MEVVEFFIFMLNFFITNTCCVEAHYKKYPVNGYVSTLVVLVVVLVLVLPLLLLMSFKKKQKANCGDKHKEI